MSLEPPDMSALWLERLALGELELRDVDLAARGLERSAVEAAVEALREQNEAFNGSLPAALRDLEVSEAAPQQSPWMWAAAAALLLGLGAAWWFSQPAPESPSLPIAQGPRPGPESGDRIKGDTHLYVLRQDGGAESELSDRDQARPGDLLQLAYRAGPAQSGVILSIDGAGTATLHFPAQPTDTPLLDRRGRVALDHAFELDEAPDFERFFFVTSRPGEQLRVTEVLEAARELAQSDEAAKGKLDLPGAWSQTSLLLDKSN
jgi:hypothetical protein